MINRLIVSLATDSIGTVLAPTIDYKHCMNRLQKKHECKLCRQVCSRDAIFIEKHHIKINNELCRGCHLCSGICPTQCITPHRSFIKSTGTLKGDSLAIYCRLSKGDNAGVIVPCVASLPWEFYAYFSYKRPLSITTNNCENCNNSAKKFILEMNKRLEMFWGDEYKNRISFYISDEENRSELSRREFFGFFSRAAKKVGESFDVLLPENTSFRSLLAAQIEDSITHGWLSWKVEEQCWGCGVCTKICPNKAFSVINENGTSVLAHDVKRCAGCGVCKLTCPEGCIKEQFIYSAPGASVVHNTIKSKLCEVCGCNIKPGELTKCGLCKSRKNKPRI